MEPRLESMGELVEELDFLSSEKPETALAMAGEIFAKFGDGEEEFANPVLTGEIFDDVEELTCQVVRELVKSSSMQASSQNQEHFDVTVHNKNSTSSCTKFFPNLTTAQISPRLNSIPASLLWVSSFKPIRLLLSLHTPRKRLEASTSLFTCQVASGMRD